MPDISLFDLLDARAAAQVAFERARAEAAETELAAAIAAGTTFVYDQTVPTDTWYINHNLNRRYPDVNIVIDGDKVSADIHYTDDNNLIVTFTIPLAGTARIN